MAFSPTFHSTTEQQGSDANDVEVTSSNVGSLSNQPHLTEDQATDEANSYRQVPNDKKMFVFVARPEIYLKNN